MGDNVTSVGIFTSDLERLKARQLRASADQGRRLTMAEIIRALIDAAEAKAEAGE